MTLAAPPAQASHGSRATTHGAHGKPAAGDSAAPGGAFSALMSALGEDDACVSPAGTATDASTADPLASLATRPVADAGTAVTADTAGMASLLAQSGLAGSAIAQHAPAPDSPAAGDARAALQAGIPLQAPGIAAPAHPGKPGTLPDGNSLVADASAAQPPLDEVRPAVLKLAEQAQGQTASGSTPAAHGSHGTAVQDLQAQAQRAQATQQEARLLQPLVVAQAQASPQADLQSLRELLAGSAPVGPARSERRSNERGNAGAEGLVSGQPQGQSLPTYSVTPSAPLPEGQQFSEQVRYWIANDVQNAQMQLDGLGDKPVEVNISLHGNQAHVAFRSDELQARSALESAGSQLKDMLQREGLVLAGVSVGSSQSGASGQAGQGAADSGARRPRTGLRPAQGVAAVAVPVQAPRSAGTAGRSVDLFV